MPSRWIALALALALGCTDDAPAPTCARYAGPPRVTLGAGRARVTLRLDRFGMQVADASGRVMLDTLDETRATPGDAARPFGAVGATRRSVTILEPSILGDGWDHATITDAPWLHGSAVTSARVEGDTATVELCDPARVGVPLRLTVTARDDEVRVEARPLGGGADAGAAALDRVGMSFALGPDEHFFALGERYVTVDHRGQRFESWVEEAGFSRGEGHEPGPQNPFPNGLGMSHIPTPFVLSSRGYGLWVESAARSGFDLGKALPDAWRLYVDEPVLRLRVLVHDEPRASLDHFTRLTGRPRAPAPWVFAPRRRSGSTTRVMGVPEHELLRQRGVATTMIDDTTHFLPDATQTGSEAQRRTWCATLHEWGYKSIGYFTPYVSAERPAVSALYAYGRANNLFVRLASGEVHTPLLGSNGWQRVASIDFTNPEAVRWWGTLLQTALDLGYDGWMLDFGEYIPYGARMHDGRSGWDAHNEYPVLVQRATSEYLRRARGDDFMFFVRSGFTGTQAHVPMVWSGDPTTAFDEARGLPSSVRAGINAGLTGLPFWGSDISGYTCLNVQPADKEVYLRWTEFGAFSPDMHDEDACEGAAPGAPPKWTLWSDAETTEVYARYARLHTRLVPYIHAAAKEAEATGMPIMRHPLLTHPREAAALAVRHEYWFGPALYVAPVVRRGERSRALWLPPGGWVDWWTLAFTEGGRTVTREAPLGTIPVFHRVGTLVPLLDPRVDTLAPDRRPDVVSAADVADVMDVRGALRAGDPAATSALSDGSAYEAVASAGAPTLPEGWTTAATEAELSTCQRCGRIDPIATGGRRLRLSTGSGANVTVTAGAVRLTHRATRSLRVRWDVVVLP